MQLIDYHIKQTGDSQLIAYTQFRTPAFNWLKYRNEFELSRYFL